MATMQYQLTLPGILARAELLFGDKQAIVSRTAGGMHRYTFREFGQRTRRLAAALQALGVGKGDRVATFAWNTHRHLEVYFAAPCMGAVYHTINLRLPPEHIIHVANHAGDRVLLVDPDLLPAVEKLAPYLKTIQHYIIMSDSAEPPQTSLPNAHAYEALLQDAEPMAAWPELSEWDPAGMCYSSATTGLPKGVTYTHRAIWIHSMLLGLADGPGLRERDVAMCIVPMFHANAWGVPFSAVWFGTTQVFPGPRPDARVFLQLIQDEKVTLTAGVPTIFMGLLAHLEKESFDLSSLERLLCGGAAPPRALIVAVEKKLGIPFIHGYGMTEAAPVTHLSVFKSHMDGWDEERRYDVKAKQGLIQPGLEMRVVNADGREVARDGKEMGEVVLRGAWIADEYYNDHRSPDTFRDGWYYTGDVATVDSEGYMAIVDRVKDIIKSGGEWISSVDLENFVMAHPAVAEAAVIGVEHRKWQERPLACVVLKPGHEATAREILDHVGTRFARWWVPDDVVFIQEVPKTSVGKFDKKKLREEFSDYLLARE